MNQPNEAEDKLRRVLEIQKKKLLIAINQIPIEIADQFSSEDEQLVKDVVKLGQVRVRLPSKPWDHSKAREIVRTTLKKNTPFLLLTYLRCAESLCFAIKDKNWCLSTQSFVEYILTHARKFGDPSNTIFRDIAPLTIDQDCSSIDSTPETPHDSSIVKRAKQLIVELSEKYDETKFQTLNAYSTCFALVVLRRHVKKRQTYIPQFGVNISGSEYLVIEAYLNTDDEKTKKNLRETCVKYMEWYDMELPHLFHKVLDMYGIEASELWDILSSLEHSTHIVQLSLINFAAEYYSNYQLSKPDLPQSQHWFPYCHFFGRSFHKRVSNEENTIICKILKLIVMMQEKREDVVYRYEDPSYKEWARKVATKLCKNSNQ